MLIAEEKPNHQPEMLVVEDSPTQAELLKNILEQKGYRVSVAGSGEEALDLMVQRAPTVVISDVNMPGMDGYELCRRIRKNPLFARIPVVLLTSLSDARDVLNGLECGADNFITKPYDPKRLLSRIQNICTSLELRRGERMQIGVEVFFGGQRHFITSERQQILDLLLATYETAVQVNLDLKRTQEELKAANRDLEKKVAERTAALQQELAERKRAEERVREQAALLDKARDAIMVQDLQHRVVYWNRGAERLFGWSSAEVLGKSIHEFLCEEFAAHEEKALKSLLSAGEWSGEICFRTREKKPFIVESRRTLLLDSAGNAHSVLIINTDITEKKQLQEQFLRAQRLETIGALAGGVAHDLNNVLAPVLMASEMLESDLTSESSRAMLEIIKSSAVRGGEIVRQILSFARGGVPGRNVFQVGHLLREAVKFAKRTFPRTIAIELEIAPGLWPIEGDATQVDQVLMNLLVNARDAMKAGGTIRVTAENTMLEDKAVAGDTRRASGLHMVLTVSDTGCGIAPQELERVFEPFYTTKGPGQGTGLGLATVATILKAHNAVAEVSSKPGQGTRFSIYFPASESEGTVDELETSPELPRGNGEWVLLVDDEQSFVQMSRVSLETSNYRVLSAFNGAEALRIYQENSEKIALLVTDCLMPALSGPALIAEVHRINPALPVIVTTGLGSEGGLKKGEDSKITSVLSKPFKPEDLLLAIHRGLQQQ